MANNVDIELANLKSESYRGIARVPLRALNFEHSLVQRQHRELSYQNVRRLERIYEHSGCLRFEADNVINAIVADDDLVEVLSLAGHSSDAFQSIQWPRDAPSLDLGRVRCLSGLHRIEAAKRFLNENDKWWVVRLFSDTTPQPILTRIIESYMHEQKPADGEVFRKIRLYHRANDEVSENRWWACLDCSKLKDLRQLIKRTRLAAAFDELIDIPGLWARLQLGALHRLLALKCDEEMILYLEHVARNWRKILRNGETDMPGSVVDSSTVQQLELLSPGSSIVETELLRDMMERKALFPSQTDPEIRDALFNNISGLPGLIPSLHTFFEMLKFIEPICTVLRQLMGKDKMKGTIRSTLMGYYFRPERVLVQVTESLETAVDLPTGAYELSKLLAYAELWAYCGRHIDDLVSFTPRKETGEARPAVKSRNPVAWQQLAAFALSRGFKLPHAEQLARSDSRAELALEYLRRANPTITHFGRDHIERVRDASQPLDQASLSSFLEDTEVIDMERRLGRPFARDFEKDKSLLFIPRLFAVPNGQTRITHTMARRDLLDIIFGPLGDLLEELDIDVYFSSLSGSNTPETADDTINVDHDMQTDSPRHGPSEELWAERLDACTREKDALLTRKQAECDKLRSETITLRHEKGHLHTELDQLRRQITLLQEKHAKVKQDFKRAVERNKRSPMRLSVNKSRRSNIALLATRASRMFESSPSVATSPQDSAAERPTLANVSEDAPQIGPIEQTWTEPLDGALELFFVTSVDPQGTFKGFSYRVSGDDGSMALIDTNRILGIVREQLGGAFALCAPDRRRIAFIEQRPGNAQPALIATLQQTRTLLIGAEATIEALTSQGTTASSSIISQMVTTYETLRRESASLQIPPRKGISTDDKHRNQRRVIVDKAALATLRDHDSSEGSSDDDLPRKRQH